MPNPNLQILVEPDQLAAHVGDAGLLIVDMRSAGGYAQGHISGAVNLDYPTIVRGAPPAMGLLPDEAHLSAVLSRIGLMPDTRVVAYDDEGGGRASRLLWTLDVLGHRHLSLLNGGLQAWVAAGHKLDQTVTQPSSSNYQARLANPAAMAEKEHIVSRLGSPDTSILDTRTPGEYQGQDVRAARGGHIPGAVNMNWTDAIDTQRNLRFKSEETLRSMLEAIGVTRDKEVIVYCQTHHRSAHTYMVLKYLGYDKVRGYAGAWSEWGNDPSLPVE